MLDIYLFSLMLLLYPLNAFNHLLYLIPQVILITIMTLRIFTLNKYFIDKNLIYISLLSFLIFTIPLAIELTSYESDLKQYLKIPINVITIILIGISGTKLINYNSDKFILYIVLIFLAFTIYSYSDKSIIEIILNISQNMGDSSVLYGSTDGLTDIFLTKNISSMYFISLYAYFLFLKKIFNKKLMFIEIIIFFLLIGLFFSRQAYLSFFVLTYLYFLFSDVKNRYKFFISLFLLLIFIFLITIIFDFNNSNDGASQRLELWHYFFTNDNLNYFIGNGIKEMNKELINTIGIDNYHMFFMNQIATYGIVFFLALNTLLFLIFINAYNKSKFTFFLFTAYYINILFQTHGYEFQNLFLLMSLISLYRKKRRISNDKTINNNPNI